MGKTSFRILWGNCTAIGIYDDPSYMDVVVAEISFNDFLTLRHAMHT